MTPSITRSYEAYVDRRVRPPGQHETQIASEFPAAVGAESHFNDASFPGVERREHGEGSETGIGRREVPDVYRSPPGVGDR